ncbi:KIN17-like protein [Forsythia ovata]|uniref:KIN17-like protein n=1 Tax=Forsythia ovata TaxID=205694 RepID=A0ABD1X8D2_9LAMI
MTSTTVNENGSDQVETKTRMLEKSEGDGDKKIKLSLGSTKNVVAKEKGESSRLVFDEVENDSNNGKSKREVQMSGKNGAGASVLDEMMREQEKAKERSNRKDYWLWEGIVVKVMSKALAEKGYYKQKGIVRKVIDKYVGEIEMLESKHVLRVDQEELETVIPQIGGLVKIVNGAYRGSNARLLSVNTENFCAKLQIEKGIYDGRVLKAVEYEDICKLAHQWGPYQRIEKRRKERERRLWRESKRKGITTIKDGKEVNVARKMGSLSKRLLVSSNDESGKGKREKVSVRDGESPEEL